MDLDYDVEADYNIMANFNNRPTIMRLLSVFKDLARDGYQKTKDPACKEIYLYSTSLLRRLKAEISDVTSQELEEWDRMIEKMEL